MNREFDVDGIIESSLKLVPQQYIDYALKTNNEKLFNEVIELFDLKLSD